MVLVANETIRETLDRVLLLIDLARLCSVRMSQQILPAQSIRLECSKVILPRDQLIGLLLKKSPRVEKF